MGSSGQPTARSGVGSWRSFASALLFVIPSMAVLVTASAVLGPGAPRPAFAARVFGVALAGPDGLALRLETVASFYGVVTPEPGIPLAVETGDDLGAPPVWTGVTGPDGVVEVQLPPMPTVKRAETFRVYARPKGRQKRALLAFGQLNLRDPPPLFAQLGSIAGSSRGELEVRADAARGGFATPFPEDVQLTVTSSAGPASGAELVLSGDGIDVSPPRVITDMHGLAKVKVKPLGHQVELSVEAHRGAETGHWEGVLPVTPGAIWIEPNENTDDWTLLSPSPRERAFVSLWTEAGRVAGEIVPLVPDEKGFFRGHFRPRAPRASRVLAAVVSGDPLERGVGTVRWPLRPAEGAVALPPIELLADGLPAASDREKARAWHARRAAVFVVVAAALVEVLLLLTVTGQAKRNLEAHLLRASAGADGGGPLRRADRTAILRTSRDVPTLSALLLVAVVALAFAAYAVVSTFV